MPKKIPRPHAVIAAKSFGVPRERLIDKDEPHSARKEQDDGEPEAVGAKEIQSVQLFVEKMELQDRQSYRT